MCAYAFAVFCMCYSQVAHKARHSDGQLYCIKRIPMHNKVRAQRALSSRRWLAQLESAQQQSSNSAASVHGEPQYVHAWDIPRASVCACPSWGTPWGVHLSCLHGAAWHAQSDQEATLKEATLLSSLEHPNIIRCAPDCCGGDREQHKQAPTLRSLSASACGRA